jgi:hypothetical protein
MLSQLTTEWLQINPKSRATAEECLSHPWLRSLDDLEDSWEGETRRGRDRHERESDREEPFADDLERLSYFDSKHNS